MVSPENVNGSSVNPYASPKAEFGTAVVSTRGHRLFPLWIWLGIAVVASWLGTPADPQSMFIALAYGLVSFCAGAILGSSLNIIVRVVPVIIVVVPVIYFVLPDGGYYAVVALCYVLACIPLGFWACRIIGSGRLRIISCFCAGYVLGTIAVPLLGTVVGAALGAILAKRSLPRADG